MSTSYTEKTHSAFHGAPIDTSDPKTLAWLIRRHGLEMTHISRGSHIGAIFSVAEIMAVLYTRILRVDPKNPQWENRDRLILSKGHAGASVYAALAERGFFPVEELRYYRSIKGHMSGHVEMKYVPGVDMSTGSLGQGISVAVGMALRKCPQVLINVRFGESKVDPVEHPAGKEACARVTAAMNGRGRVLLRKSGTEPLVRVMVEARDAAQAQACAERLAAALA